MKVNLNDYAHKVRPAPNGLECMECIAQSIWQEYFRRMGKTYSGCTFKITTWYDVCKCGHYRLVHGGPQDDCGQELDGDFCGCAHFQNIKGD
jgi:hypothetical protein